MYSLNNKDKDEDENNSKYSDRLQNILNNVSIDKSYNSNSIINNNNNINPKTGFSNRLTSILENTVGLDDFYSSQEKLLKITQKTIHDKINNEIKKLWSNPILRYSNILSGLFHEKVVVCESDYDCLFYQAIVNAIDEHKGDAAVDILFTHCGGKSRAKDVVSALRAVNVPVIAVCDFDLLNASQNFRPLLEAVGLDWSSILSAGMKTIYDEMNSKSNSETDAWKQIKKIGKAGFTGDSPAAYEKVERMCKKAGLFIVPVGEMECFDKTINKEKKEWVYHVLENYDLATEPKLDEARKFVQAIVDY